MSEPARKKPASIATDASRNAWQRELANAISDVPELLAAIGLSDRMHELPVIHDAGFPLRVPRGFVARMRYGDPSDPLLRQVLPVADERLSVPGFVPDPVGDLASQRCNGLLQKYHGRALLITTGACAVHCRYCFRRNYPYNEASVTDSTLSSVLQHVACDPTMREIILSGGDPLSLSNRKLRRIIDQLGAIEHVERIRIHTRQPVSLPERVDAELIAILQNAPKKIVIVVHCNHANEIDGTVADKLHRLAACSSALLNQSVLLRGVNDSSQALVELSEKLFASGVLPYYLHQLDRVDGAAHFSVTDEVARRIIREVAHRLPGYLVPKLVRENAGDPSKSPL